MGNNMAVDTTRYSFPSAALREDIYAGPLYNQMMYNQMAYSTPQQGYYPQAYYPQGTDPGANPAQNPQQAAAGGGVRPIWPALGVGGAAYLAGTRLNFIKPVGADGKFTEEFLSHYSGEYAVLQNGANLKKFYEGVGKGVTAENFNPLMQELERLGLQNSPEEIAKAAENNPLLKSFLKEKGIMNADGKLVDDAVRRVQIEFSAHTSKFNQVVPRCNYALESQMANEFKGLSEIWSKCTTREAKIDFLKKNSKVLGLEEGVIRTLHFNPQNIAEADLNILYNSHYTASRGTILSEAATRTKAGMQGLSGAWKGEKWYSWGNKFEHSGKGVAESLGNGLKSLRKSKVKWVAAIAAVGTWAYCKFCR